MKPVLLGPSYSVYVRIARLALIEKGVDYDHTEFDVFDHSDWPADWLERQPFGLVPAFEHDGFRLYEARAITRYVDEAFEGPPLEPTRATELARMEQVISVLDGQAYRPMVRAVFVQALERARKLDYDAAAIAEALPKTARCLAALAELLGDQTYFAGAAFSRADAQAVPMFQYFLFAEEGQQQLQAHPNLERWWTQVSARSSVQSTYTPPAVS